METGAPRLDQHPGGRAHEHAGDDSRSIAVLPQQVTDALAVACADGCGVNVFPWMLDDDPRVVCNPRSAIECPDQVVDLLPRRRRQAQPLVECADPLDDLALQEDRERDRAVPQILPGEHRGALRPPRLAARHAVQSCEALGDSLQQVGRIDAIVIWKRHGIGAQPRHRGVPRTREASRRADALDLERRMRRQHRGDALVVVLVGDEHAEVAVGLRLERVEEAVELVDAVDGRDDEIESHGRTLTPMPLVSVLLAVRDDARFLPEAIDSVLNQTLADLELVVVDDASTDETPRVLSDVDDARLVVLRNDTRLGLAASLNRALEEASGKYAARLDADDVAASGRLARQVERLRARPQVAIVGSAVTDLDEHGAPGRTHVMPAGAVPVRWHALFSSPFFHPTVLVDREALEMHGLRYDPAFDESEDYDLWTRLLAFVDGDNVREGLVLKRVHPGQASQRRQDVQESFQRRVALREIAKVANDVDAEAAWRVGARKNGGSRVEFVRVLRAFEARHGSDWNVRRAALRALVS